MSRGDWRRTVVGAAIVVAAGGLTAPTLAEPLDLSPVDCLGPAADAAPDTPEWRLREAQNLYCANQRLLDKAQHPAAALATDPQLGPVEMAARDVYRMPSRHDGRRFRFHADTVTNRDGLPVPVELYRPCAPGTCDGLPGTLQPHEPPYPVVIIVPGGDAVTTPGTPMEVYRWAAQGLAEAGYLAVIHDVTSFHLEDAQDVLNWVLASPGAPTGAGEHNPFWSDVDGDHVGIAGHSGGGATAARLGQLDPRFKAIVTFDRSSRYDLPEDDAAITKPALFFVGDYGIGTEPHQTEPDPDGTGNKVEDFVRLRALGVDTMHLALRAASHIDWSPISGNRYAEGVTLYYTVAWFDRYLKGATDPAMAGDAFKRLTASEFDSSGDVHNISQGFFDPVQAVSSADPYGGNVPYTIAGTSVSDRLSFYFRSRCFISVPDSKSMATSDDMRNGGCAPPDGNDQ